MVNYDSTHDDDRANVSLPRKTQPNEIPMIILPDGKKPVDIGSGYITGILGEGGMAIVYEIWNEQLGVKRAIKLLRPNSSPEIRERFDKEIKITAQLDHPNIIDIHNVGMWNNLPYIEMEMIDGVSLDELIKKKGNLPLGVCTAIGIIICKALDYTHHHEYTIGNVECKGLMHSDLKPGNLLISKQGIVRLTDFGIATPKNVRIQTSSGKIIGSMQYLAPEQLEEHAIDPRSDVFSFGCILYEMLVGERTFPDRNITRLVRKRLKNIFKPLTSYELEIPQKLKNLVNTCLQPQVNKRPKDIKMVQEALTKIHYSLTTQTPENIITSFTKGESIEETKNTIPFKFPLKKVASIALLLFGITVIGIFFYNDRLDRTQNNFTMAIVTKQPEQQRTINESKTNITPVLKTINSEQDKIVDKPVKILEPSALSQTPAPIPNNNKKVASLLDNNYIPIKRIKKIIPSPKNQESIVKADTLSPLGEVIDKSTPIVALESLHKPDTTLRFLTFKAEEELNNTKKKEPERYVSLLQELKIKYNVSNPIDIMLLEDKEKHYFNVMEVYKELPPSQASSKTARILKHRALVATDQTDQSYFDNNHINDGEFYLSKAQHLYNTAQYQRAIWLLGIIKTSPISLIDKKVIFDKVLYFTAKCNTAIFNSTPTPNMQRAAMQSWFTVKSEFRKNQNHPYFAEANREIRKISKRSLN